MRLFDNKGSPIAMGREIARGGEGKVVELTSDLSQVVKIYHNAVGSEKRQKLEAMSRAANPGLLRVAAWPTATVHDGPNGPVVGVILPKVSNHREIHELYSPAQRRLHFGKADWSFLLHVAMNCAAAFETVHDGGHVIGDVNQGGVLVSENGTVRLIDCDSFQIRENGRIFYCEVAVPQYTPPELQGRSSFHGVPRTNAHDCFGLAVMIFHLLFMGRHPYAGRYHGAGDMPIETAISQSRFAFGSNAASFQMARPPHSLPLTEISATLSALFERAFAAPATSSTFLRPTAREWRETLHDAKKRLSKCSTDPAHVYFSFLAQCPWCRIELSGGPAFFVSVLTTFEFDPSFDLSKMWALILAVPAPLSPAAVALPKLPDNQIPTPLPPGARADLLGPLREIPEEPRLRQAPLPEIPVFIPDVVPDDPELFVEPMPKSPSKPSDAALHDVRRQFLESRSTGDYRVAKWGTIAVVGISIALIWLPPAAVGAAVLALPFGITWLLSFLSTRRKYREELTDAQKLIAAQYDVYEKRLMTYDDAVVAVKARNAIHRESWEDRLAHLAHLRRELPEGNSRRFVEWETTVKAIEAERETVQRRNVALYQLWVKEVAEYKVLRISLARHNAAIHEAERARLAERQRRMDVFRQVRRKVDELLLAWEREALSLKAEYDVELVRLSECKGQYSELMTEFEQDRDALVRNQYDVQLRDHFGNAVIAIEEITGIKKGKKALLALHGIETALDIDPRALDEIPGIGPVTIQYLMDWRQAVLQRFRLDITKAIPQHDLRSLHMRFHAKRKVLRRELIAGPATLDAISQRGRIQAGECTKAVAILVPAVARANADMKVFEDLLDYARV